MRATIRRPIPIIILILVVAAVGLLVVALAGILRSPSANGPSPSAARPLAAVDWRTEVVALQATDLWVEVGGRRFMPPAEQIRVASDLGNATYRTLEVTWLDGATEMRINLYFNADPSGWWVDEIRTYDGRPRGDWLYARGRFFQTPSGATWTGDIEVPLGDLDGRGTGPGILHLGGLRLSMLAALP